MPYQSVSDLPAEIRKKYGKCSRAFLRAFNSTHSRTGDESRSFAIGHAAAKRCQQKGASVTNAASAARKLPPLGPGGFRFVTNALTADNGQDNGPRRFRAVASSTITDLAGNTISPRALFQMRDDFRSGLTIFMDHDYENVVDKVFGMSDTAEVMETGAKDERTGKPIYDLVIGGIVNEPNPRAIQLHESIAGGYVKFGTSIGAIVRKHSRDKETGGMLIDSITAKEASIVGIPKNQRSWAYKASVAAADLDTDEHLADDDPEEDEVHEEQVVVASTGETLQQWVVTAPTGTNTSSSTITVSSVSSPIETPTEPEPAPEPETEPTLTESVTLDETTPGGQEADAATPETAPEAIGEAPDPAIEQQAAEIIEAADVVKLVNFTKDLVEEIGRLRLVIENKDAELATVQASYSQLASVERDATEAIQKVMSLPLRRQAVGQVNDFTARYPGLDPRVSAYIARRATQEKE